MVTRKIPTRRPLPVTLLLLVVLLLQSVTVAAAPATLNGKPAVVDGAEYFTADEEESFAEQLVKLSDEYNMDLLIVTELDTGGKSPRDFADDYFDYNDYGRDEERHGVLMLLTYSDIWISTSGISIRYLTDGRINTIINQRMVPAYKKNESFADMAQAYIDALAEYLEAGIPSDQRNVPERVRSLTLMNVVAAFVGAIAVGVLFFLLNLGRYRKRKKAPVYNLAALATPSYTVFEDIVTGTSVTSRRIERQSSSGSSGGSTSTTHTSSSGRTHGGGGGSFR
ncbi:MAG: TPM domain-containing protein [Bacillota bacterium]|nr:TPM domain-containing protein [Bacillota bacterium]